MPGREVVDAGHLLARAEQCFEEMRADEAGTPRNEPAPPRGCQLRGQRLRGFAHSRQTV
jgi:hypothetical protein